MVMMDSAFVRSFLRKREKTIITGEGVSDLDLIREMRGIYEHTLEKALQEQQYRRDEKYARVNAELEDE